MSVGQVPVARGVGPGGFLRIVVGGRLLGADQRDLGRPACPRPQVDELLAAQAATPAQALHHDRTLEHEPAALLVAEGDGPAAELVEALERVRDLAHGAVDP